MVEIIQDQVPSDHPLDRYPMTPAYITIHETANTNPGATAAMHGRYLLSAEAVQREVLWHFTVDDREIRQHLPTHLNGWHAGDGFDGPGNRTSIGIEICVNQDGDFDKAKANAAALVSHLIATHPSLRPYPDCIVQHNHWSGKNCPAQIRAVAGEWERFVASIQPRPAWDPGDEVRRLIESGLINTWHEPSEAVTWGQLATVLNRLLARMEGRG